MWPKKQRCEGLVVGFFGLVFVCLFICFCFVCGFACFVCCWGGLLLLFCFFPGKKINIGKIHRKKGKHVYGEWLNKAE